LTRFDSDAIVMLCKCFDCAIGDLLVLENDAKDQQ